MAHVVMVLSGFERYAARWLQQRLALQSYLPMVRTRKVRRGLVCDVTEPLFRRYLFITNLHDEWRGVLETRGVLRFLNHGGYPSEIEDDELVAIGPMELTSR